MTKHFDDLNDFDYPMYNKPEYEFDVEEWREIPGHSGYFASTKGRIRNSKWKILKPTFSNHGYERIELWSNGKFESAYTHRLVATVYPEICGSPTREKCIVLHGKEGVRDNSPENLRWGSHKENSLDRRRDGTDRGVRVIRSDGV